jgi:hypothetical protein
MDALYILIAVLFFASTAAVFRTAGREGDDEKGGRS